MKGDAAMTTVINSVLAIVVLVAIAFEFARTIWR